MKTSMVWGVAQHRLTNDDEQPPDHPERRASDESTESRLTHCSGDDMRVALQVIKTRVCGAEMVSQGCLLYTSPSPRDS